MIKRILISTGGSGGHVVPATILYEHLKDKFHISISTDKRGIKFLDKNKYNLEISLSSCFEKYKYIKTKGADGRIPITKYKNI